MHLRDNQTWGYIAQKYIPTEHILASIPLSVQGLVFISKSHPTCSATRTILYLEPKPIIRARLLSLLLSKHLL